MSLPPVTVHIKRKFTDEPVDYLRVQESNGGGRKSNGKRRLTDFVFSRQIQHIDEPAPSPAGAPGDRLVKQLPRSASSQAFGVQTHSPHTQVQEAGLLVVARTESSQAGQTTPLSNSIAGSTRPDAAPANPLSSKRQPRKFHISRSPSSTPSRQSTSGRVQKRIALFVERRTRTRISPAASALLLTPALTPEPEQAPSQKKPGQAARTSTAPPSNTTISHPQLAPEPRNVRLPSGLIAPWSLSDQKLVEEMQAYTLQEIGHSIVEADATQPGGSPATRPIQKPSRFVPKVPKLRYHERHPEQFTDQENDMEGEELLDDMDMDDDSEYIIDTYIRMPAEDVDVNSSAEFGFLVLDGQSDIDEFYSGEPESEEDEDYDEEDENAENHYTADYPDDDVDSDDEYDRNPYQYTNDDDAAFSDDSDDGTRYPWSKKPAWLRKAEHGRNGDDEDD